MTKQQGFNPFLPSYEYIPDGEPHVFGDRVYLFGSHDKFDGNQFCMNDYVCYSANVQNLKEWKYEGVIYRKDQDPRNKAGAHFLWAPDVTRGLDGRYYLYYCLNRTFQVAVAVCDTPAGEYEYLGLVCHADGVPLGEKENDYMQFDPGVFVDDDGTVYLYSGMAARMESQRGQNHLQSQVMMLESDMITLKTEPIPFIPSMFTSGGTGFEGHEFFEASSMRKINGKYYFVYSSVESQELCYAVSDRPDQGFKYGGTIVSIGDIGLNGRAYEDALNFWGNTHGSIECIDGEWYVFYHRHTNRTQFSRQACAEKITILPDGKIPQVEITSCGFNGGPLDGKGTYEARIACNLLGKNGTVMSRIQDQTEEYPYFTQEGIDWGPEISEKSQNLLYPISYIANMRDGAVVGFKYFSLSSLKGISCKVRGTKDTRGCFIISDSLRGEERGRIYINMEHENEYAELYDVSEHPKWISCHGKVNIQDGIKALYLEYRGEGAVDLLSFTME